MPDGVTGSQVFVSICEIVKNSVFLNFDMSVLDFDCTLHTETQSGTTGGETSPARGPVKIFVLGLGPRLKIDLSFPDSRSKSI